MPILGNKSDETVGLDIDAGSIAAAEVRSNGTAELARAGAAELEAGIFNEGEVGDAEALSDALKALFAEHELSSKVRIGVANQRVAVRMLRLPQIDSAEELETAIRFQAQDHIPMPLDQAVLDWQVVGHTVDESGARFVEVVAVAARRDMLHRVLEAVRGAGLDPVGIDLSAFGMIRALAPPAAPSAVSDGGGEAPPAPRLYCNLGDVANLAVARGRTCLFTRISPFGIEGIAQRLAERQGLTMQHSRQWLAHVGLSDPLETIEGQPEHVEAARTALSEGVAKLADELRLSLDFYATQEGAVPIEGVVACGPGTTVPGLVEALEASLGHSFEIGRPPALGGLGPALASRMTLSYGLALED